MEATQGTIREDFRNPTEFQVPKRKFGFCSEAASLPTSCVFNLVVYGRPYPAYRLRALLPPLFVCFFRGGLGVGEKPACGELVRSTHRVPSHFISSERFLFETSRRATAIYGAGNSSCPFPLRFYHPFVLREARRAPHPKGCPSTAYQRRRRSLRELYGVTADPSRAGGLTLSPASSRPPVETPN